ncbi:MAG: hypothetical protein WA996_07280 [Candidatus Promineifilaceae bacterium]
MSIEDLRLIGLLILGVIVTASIAGGLLVIIGIHKVRGIDIPQDASFSETLLATPLAIVVAIDLLDLALDVLAAPLSWAVLDWLGLKALRGVAAVEALIPGTQLVPTLTLCWLGVRILGHRQRGLGQSMIGLESISTKS